jgi:hypothetical protein
MPIASEPQCWIFVGEDEKHRKGQNCNQHYLFGGWFHLAYFDGHNFDFLASTQS